MNLPSPILETRALSTEPENDAASATLNAKFLGVIYFSLRPVLLTSGLTARHASSATKKKCTTNPIIWTREPLTEVYMHRFQHISPNCLVALFVDEILQCIDISFDATTK